MFAKLRRRSDGPAPGCMSTHPRARKMAWECGKPGAVLHRILHARMFASAAVEAPRGAADYRAEPNDDQTSSLVWMRPTTSVVNSVVPAWPPRSGVRTPEAVASSTAS